MPPSPIIKIPKFSAQEQEIIKKVWPAIIENLDCPADYFIESLTITDSGITVNLYLLQHLLGPVLDGCATAYFTQDFKFISIHQYW